MLIPTSVTVILIDLDGTLVDHDAAARAGVLDLARRMNVDGDPDEIVRRWVEIEHRWFFAFERGEVDHVTQRVERCREFLGRPDMTVKEALEVYDVFLTTYRRSWRAYDDAADCVDRALASGRGVGVFTNGAPDMQTAKLTDTGLMRDGLVMLAATELGAAKPQAAAYDAALKRMGLDRERAGEAVLIGDNPVNDYRAARAHGLQAVLLDRHGARGDVTSLREIEF